MLDAFTLNRSISMSHMRNVLLGFAFASVMSAAGETPADLQTRVHDALQSLVAKKKLAGVVAGVYHAEQSQVFGLGEILLGTGKTPDGDTLFEIGSITKVFTGTLLALSDQEGRLKEDTPLRELLPAGVNAPGFEGHPILLGQLAAHTSGLPRLPDNLKPADPLDPYAGYDADALFAFLGSHTLRRKPGSEYEYSNLAAGLLGELLARNRQTDYAAMVEALLFRPLGMKDTGIALTSAQQARFAQGYRPGGLFGRLQVQGPWDLAALAGAGGVRSSVNDMLRWVRACLGEAPAPLLAAIEHAAAPRFELPGGGAVGLGWHQMSIAEGQAVMIWHNGETGGYHAFLGYVPAWKAGIAVLGNSACNFDAAAIQILESLQPR
jgi:CubicO group peptidase (beta-lactamase class C family)